MLVGEMSLGEAGAFAYGAVHVLIPLLAPNAIIESPYPLGFHKAVVLGMGLGTMLALLYPSRLLTGALAVSYMGSAYMELTGKIRWDLPDDRGLRLALAAGDLLTAAVLVTR